MTFRDISYKMFRANIARYRLFILCNVAAVAVLFSFLSIYENEKFMDYNIVHSMVSSNIAAPTYFVAIFTAVFIPYTQAAFIKARQKEYGILLTLGMAENEVLGGVFEENLVLFCMFLSGGLAAGTALSLFFQGFIRYALGIAGLGISFPFAAYVKTASCVALVFAASLAANIVSVAKSTIREKLKLPEKSEGGGGKMPLLLAGAAITAVSLVILAVSGGSGGSGGNGGGNGGSNGGGSIGDGMFLPCVLLCVAGSALVLFNGEALVSRIRDKHYAHYVRNILALSDIKYYYGKNKYIFFADAWLFFFILFFVTFAIAHYPGMARYAAIYHPFGMAYVEDNGFRIISDAELEAIAQENGDKITFSGSVRYMRSSAFTVFRAEDVNFYLGRSYSVPRGALLYVDKHDPDDGFGHEINFNAASLSVKVEGVPTEFAICGITADPLFGQVNALSDFFLLADADDYERLALDGGDFWLKGTLHLYDFEDWRHSGATADAVWKRLLALNGIDWQSYEGGRFYKVSSRIDAHHTAINGCNIMVFSFGYLGALLYFAAVVMIHFKLKMELESEKKKFRSLHRIGIHESEAKKAVYQKILAVFLVSPVYTIILNSVIYTGVLSRYWPGDASFLYTAAVSIAFLLAHIAVSLRYARAYNDRIHSA